MDCSLRTIVCQEIHNSMNQTNKIPSFPPIPVIAFGILAVSTSSIFIRYAQQDAHSLVIAAYRLTIASLILLPITLTRHKAELTALTRRDMGLGLLSGFFLAVHFATWITSLAYTSVASSVVLVSTIPLWVAMIAPFTLKEPITKQIGAGLIVALAGTVVIGVSDVCHINNGVVCPPWESFFQGEAFIGDFLALVGAWAGAGYMLIGRKLRAKTSMMVYITVVYGMAAVVLVGLMFANQLPMTGYQPRTYLWFVLLALVPQLLGHSSFNWALGYLPAAFVSITLLGEPIGTTILAVIILNEIPTPTKLFGAILILGGILIASQKNNKNK